MDLNEYEKKVRDLSAMEFESLVNSLLKNQYPGMQNFTHLGKQEGKNTPRKGKVDIWFTTQKNNKESTTFVEITTQKKDLENKIIADLKKVTQTIKKAKINVYEVIYACTGKISPETYQEAKTVLQNEGIVGEFNLKFWGIDEIVRLVKTYHPILAEEYLKISIKSGCIVPIENYGNKLNLIQDNPFLFRDNEKNEIKSILNNKKGVVLYGKPGCGKTRTALQIFKELKQDCADAEFHIVKMSGIGLFHDIKSLLEDTSKKQYILVDDANRQNYIGDIAAFAEEYNNIYIIFTVRDYALESVMTALENTDIEKYEIKNFSRENIFEIIKQGFKIQTKNTLDYILDISKGNLRFAVMAAQLIRERKKSANALPNLLEKYFNDVSKNISKLNSNKQAKNVLAALSLFKRLDIRDKVLITKLGRVFKFSESEFYDVCDELDSVEIINYYFDKNAIEIADQILADYLFYSIVIKAKKINLQDVFEMFLENHKNKFLDLFQSLINIYGQDELLIMELESVFDALAKNDNKRAEMIKYLSLFSGILPDRTLAYIIEMLKEIPIDTVRKYDKSYKDFYGQLIEILASFSDTNYDTLAIDILIDTMLSKPGMYEEIKHVICEDFTITNISHCNRYRTQNYLLKKVIGLKDYENYLDLMNGVLRKQFPLTQQSSESKGRSIMLYSVRMCNMKESREQRDLIWRGIKILLDNSYEFSNILKIVSYGNDIEKSDELKRLDKKHALQICEELDLSNMNNKLFAINFLGNFKNMHGVKEFIDSLIVDPTLKFCYDNIFCLTRKYINGNALKCEVNKLCQVVNYEKVINDLVCISRYISKDYDSWRCNETIELVFEVIFEKNKERYVDLVKNYIEIHPETEIRPLLILKRLNEFLTPTEIIRLLQESNLIFIQTWIAQYLVGLPKHIIDDDLYDFAIGFFVNEYPKTTVYWGNECADSLMSFEEYRAGFILNIIKGQKEYNKLDVLKHFCPCLFSGEYSLANLACLFGNDIEYIKEIYLCLVLEKAIFDSEGDLAIQLFYNDVENQRQLLEYYIKEDDVYLEHKVFYQFSGFIDAFICIISKIRYINLNTQIKKLICDMENNLFDIFINEFFKNYKNDDDLMFEMSNIIEDVSKEKQIRFAKLAIENKLAIEIMKRMSFFDGPSCWTNSRIPYIEENIAILEKFIKDIEMSVDYKVFFNDRLKRLKNQLKSTEIEEFNDDLII